MYERKVINVEHGSFTPLVHPTSRAGVLLSQSQRLEIRQPCLKQGDATIQHNTWLHLLQEYLFTDWFCCCASTLGQVFISLSCSDLNFHDWPMDVIVNEVQCLCYSPDSKFQHSLICYYHCHNFYFSISNELSLGTNLITNNDCLRFGQLLWPASGRKVKTSVGSVN